MISAFVTGAFTAAALANASPLAERAPALRGPVVVVLWATWCASCRAELARLDRIASAAGPLPVRTLAIDPPDAARARLLADRRPLRGAYADQRDKALVLADWGGTALPLAVAIDAAGRVCGRRSGLLGTDQLKQWARACSK